MNLTDIGSNICKKTDPSCDFLQSFQTNELVVQKCKLKRKLQPRTRHEVPNGNRNMTVLFLLLYHNMEVGGQGHAPAALFSGKTCGSWVGSTISLDGCGKFLPTGIRSLDSQVHSESLWTLLYHSPQCRWVHGRFLPYCSPLILLVTYGFYV
jgi:hypothetical protein